jgi:Flp pilus assembly protein TadG
VETSVVSMFLVILLMGIIESSFLFKDWVAVSAAARAGARMGASQSKVPAFAQSSADQVANSISGLTPANVKEVWVYRTTGASGLPDSGSFGSCTVCVKYTWNGTSMVQSYNNWNSGLATASPPGEDACLGSATRDSLGVYVKYQHTSPLGFFFNGQILNESTVMWLEPAPSASCKS